MVIRVTPAEGLHALNMLRSTIRKHYTCEDDTADAWALRHWETAVAALRNAQQDIEDHELGALP